jgi:hypothetical protein
MKTVDQQKLEEQIRSNMAEENIDLTNIQIKSATQRQREASALAGASAKASNGNTKRIIDGYRKVVDDKNKDLNRITTMIGKLDPADPAQAQQIAALEQERRKAEYDRTVAQSAALALSTGDAVDATTAAQIGQTAATPQTPAAEKPKDASQAKAAATNAAEVAKFLDYQDAATNLATDYTNGGTDDPAIAFERAAKVSKQTGQKIKIPQSRYDEIKRYVEGRTTGWDTTRGVMNTILLGAPKNVGTKMRNAKAIWKMMDKYPNSWSIVGDNSFDADYGG